MPQTKIVIEQIGSPIRRPSIQRRTLQGLRLNRIGRIAELQDTPEIRGMIAKVKHLVRVVYATSELDSFAAEVTSEYHDLLTGPGRRVVRGASLWKQFLAAVAHYHAGRGNDDRRIIECVNEMAVAKFLVEDPALPAARIEYEPDLLPNGGKIDFVVNDVLGREWQLGTIQVDYNLPERFDLTYIGADNQPHRPVMIHRAPFGTMERFIGVLIEHFAGAFPTWLAPEQVRVLTISEMSAAFVS